MPDLKRKPAGQSLMEMIVAIAVLLLVVVAVLSLVTSNVAGQQATEAQVIANNLARESLEVVRMMRDTNWLKGVPFDTGITGGFPYHTVTALNLSTGTWSLASILYTTDPVVHITNGVYVQPSGAAPTPYKRSLGFEQICQLPSGSESFIAAGCSGPVGTKIGVRVTVGVWWTDQRGDHSVTQQELLYAWK